MKIVIDIDDNLYTRLFDNGVDNYDDAADMATAIRKGTPLPEHHGRLIDADAIPRHLVRDIDEIDKQPTIIEADERSESE